MSGSMLASELVEELIAVVERDARHVDPRPVQDAIDEARRSYRDGRLLETCRSLFEVERLIGRLSR